MMRTHYQLTYQEARAQATNKWIDPQDYAKQPWMICHTGDAHAQGTRNKKRVTCFKCILATSCIEEINR